MEVEIEDGLKRELKFETRGGKAGGESERVRRRRGRKVRLIGKSLRLIGKRVKGKGKEIDLVCETLHFGFLVFLSVQTCCRTYLAYLSHL